MAKSGKTGKVLYSKCPFKTWLKVEKKRARHILRKTDSSSGSSSGSSVTAAEWASAGYFHELAQVDRSFRVFKPCFTIDVTKIFDCKLVKRHFSDVTILE